MMHHLKINEKHYEEVLNGGKRFEVRTNDRPFKVGDRVELKEYLGDIFIPACPDINLCLGNVTDEEDYYAMGTCCPLQRESCGEYTYQKFSGRSIYVKITHVFDISDVFAGLVAFQFEPYNVKSKG